MIGEQWVRGSMGDIASHKDPNEDDMLSIKTSTTVILIDNSSPCFHGLTSLIEAGQPHRCTKLLLLQLLQPFLMPTISLDHLPLYYLFSHANPACPPLLIVLCHFLQCLTSSTHSVHLIRFGCNLLSYRLHLNLPMFQFFPLHFC